MTKLLSIVCLSFLLTGCGVFSAYKTPIQQGRIISQKQISQVKPGMTMAQIQFILGTPGVKDPFHTQTWNYVYIYKLGGQAQTLKKLTLTFKNGKLSSLSGDYIPPTALKYQYSNTPVTAPVETVNAKPKALDPRLREDDTKNSKNDTKNSTNSAKSTTTSKQTTAHNLSSRGPSTRDPVQSDSKAKSGSTPTKNKALWELS